MSRSRSTSRCDIECLSLSVTPGGVAPTAVLGTAGVPRDPDSGEAGESADVRVGDGLPENLLGGRRRRGLLPGGRRGGYIAVGVTAAAVRGGEVQGVENLADGGVAVLLGAVAVGGVVPRRVAVSLRGAGGFGVRGVILVVPLPPGESPPDGSEQTDAP